MINCYDFDYVQYRNYSFKIYDISLNELCRYRKFFYKNAIAIAYVIDSSDIECFQYYQQDIITLAKETEHMQLPFLIITNKQDKKNAVSPSHIRDYLNLEVINKRDSCIIGTDAISGKGLNEVLDWIIEKGINK